MSNQLCQHPPPSWQALAPESGTSRASGDDVIRRCGTLLLDVDGVIRFGDLLAAEFFGCTPRALLGQPVTRHLPCLTLQAGHHGYNVAFVNFHFAGERWQHFRFADSDDAAREIGLKASFFKGVDLLPFFLIEIRTFDD
ncbi:MAG: hypothetical protein HYU74_09900 [Dechloromonas sp.]|nr:hypothetical protein [Dechloromonas sp.]